MTDRYAVIGNPVAHSKSPWIHAEFARQAGLDMAYTRIEAPLDGFAATVDAFRTSGGRGANVTLPFKEAAFQYCAATSERAQVAQAVNTLVLDRAQPWGDNTDGVGLVRDLECNLGVALNGRRILLMGAGGAARGVLAPLALAGASQLTIVNRTRARAERLIERLRGAAGTLPELAACSYAELADASFDVVVNATSAGLGGRAPELPPGLFRPGVLAYDMVYGRDTPFLRAARAHGAQAWDGAGMLVEQAAESFFLWRGVRPETRSVLAALRTSPQG